LKRDNLDWQQHRLRVYGKGGPYGGIRLTRDSWSTTIAIQKRPECLSLEAAASGA